MPTPTTLLSANNLAFSLHGIDLTEGMEGLKLTAYQDVKGIWTIGYGHTGPEVVKGLVWTQEQATQALTDDIKTAEAAVNKLVKITLNQNQFDALVDFVFNEGVEHFRGSTLLQKLNAGDLPGAQAEFKKWVYAGKKVNCGLVHRRLTEAELFSDPVAPL